MLKWNWLTFVWFDLYRRGDGDEKFFFNIFAFFFALIPFFIIGASLDSYLLPTGWSILIGALSGIGLMQSTFFVGRLHYLEGIDNSYSHNLRADMERYYKLPKEDRKEFPRNINEIVRNPHLTPYQKSDLSSSLGKTMSAIEERNRQKKVAVEYNIDIDGVLEHLEMVRHGVKEETAVYKQFNDPKVITGRL